MAPPWMRKSIMRCVDWGKKSKNSEWLQESCIIHSIIMARCPVLIKDKWGLKHKGGGSRKRAGEAERKGVREVVLNLIEVPPLTGKGMQKTSKQFSYKSIWKWTSEATFLLLLL